MSENLLCFLLTTLLLTRRPKGHVAELFAYLLFDQLKISHKDTAIFSN